MKPKILVTRKITDEAENNLAENFDVTFNKNDEPIPYEKLIDLANQYDGLVVSGWDKFDENFFNKMKGKLKIIATFSVGYDHININSAKEKNIVITNTPDVWGRAVVIILFRTLTSDLSLPFRRLKQVGRWILGAYQQHRHSEEGRQRLSLYCH